MKMIINENDLMKIISAYGIHASEIKLVSELQDYVYRIFSKPMSYSLKVYANSYDHSVYGMYYNSQSVLEAEMLFLDDLNVFLKNHSIITPKPFKTNKQRYIYSSEKYVASLTSWIEGTNCDDIVMNATDYTQIGKILGLIHNFCDLNKFCIHRRAFDCTRIAQFIKNIKKGVLLGVYSKDILQISNRWQNEIFLNSNQINSLGYSLIHGDYYKYNILKISDDMFAPIDFGMCSYGYHYQDLASICNELVDDDLKLSFLSSYSDIVNKPISFDALYLMQKYLTLFFLAANYKNVDDYSWILDT